MTSGDSSISSAGKKRLRRGCLWTLIMFSIGAYAGIAFTKWALTGPDLVRRIAHITLPAVPPVVPAPQAPAVVNNNALPQYGPANNGASGGVPNASQSPPQTNGNIGQNGPAGGTPSTSTGSGSPGSGGASSFSHGPSVPQPPQNPPAGGWLVGDWEITDMLHPTGSQSSSVTSQYMFDEGGTGEFDTNGKKLYDLHWEDAGEYLLLTFVTDAEGDQNLKVKMKYSINGDHSLLTLAPEGKKDPRGEMYNVGPGVYHRK